MRTSKELQLGKAGEYLVCADLILKGFVAFPGEQGLPYDVLLDNGKKMIRVQVKTTAGPRIIPQRARENKAYIFNIKRNGKNNKQINNDCDLFALVCLDTKLIGYILNEEMPSTINIRVDSMRGLYYDEDGEITYNKAIQLKKEGLSNRNIALRLHKDESVIGRYLQDGFVPFKTDARYFSDFIRDKVWFQKL